MKRREFLTGAAAGLGLAALRSRWAFADGERPNIVLCMADDQGWGDMAYNGHPVLKTPNFDAMAQAGLRFDRFYAAAPVCSPTRGSCLTGRHPNRFGCFSWGHPIRPQEITIAKALKSAGYATGHFGKWHLGSVLKESPVCPGASGFDEWLSAFNFFDIDPVLSREGQAVEMTGESSALTVDAALEFMRKHAQAKKPFLAVVWFGSPHNPHRALKEDEAPYAAQGKKAAFLGEIAAMDRAFGKLRDALGTLGIRENTLLWYCSDNGGLPGLGATGGRGNKGQIYEGGLRVPGLLEWPARIKEPRTTSVPCVTSDFYPTLLEIAGVKPPNQPPLDGISLLPLIEGKMEARPQPIGFWDYKIGGISTPSDKWMNEVLEAQKAGAAIPKDRLFADAGEIKKQYPEDAFPGHAAWLDGSWKLHAIAGKGGTPKLELYHLADDPKEAKDLATSEAERVTKMKVQLETWQAAVMRSLNGKDYQ